MTIPDNYPKYVVTMDEMKDTTSHRGINRLHIRDFCLKILQV
jgi:hypothetical protein